jgi:hypothetical protein
LQGGEVMTIRPVDMQVLLPKVNEVSKIQQTQNNAEQTAQQQFASQLQKEAARKESQVQGTAKGEALLINKDGSKNSHEGHEQEPSKDKHELIEEIIKDPKLGHKLDIKI